MHLGADPCVPALPFAGRVEARRSVDRRRVRPHPRTRVAQDLRLDVGHGSVGVRADVEEQVPALGDRLDEQRDHLRGREVVLDALVAVHAERVAQPAAELPAPRGRRFGNVVLIHRVVVARGEPAVVEHELEAAFGGHRARVGEYLIGAPVPARVTPMPVAPQERGLESLHQLLDLRAHVRVDIPIGVGIFGVTPVEERVVAAEHVAAPAHRVGQLGRDITLGPESGRRPGRELGVPPTEAVVVLRHVHEVPHTRVVEQLRVLVGVEAFEGQLRDEIVERPAPCMLVMPGEHLGQRAGRVQHHVGLGLEERPVPIGVLVHRRERGHGRDVGVHEHAVAALIEPHRVGAAHRGGRYSEARFRRPARSRRGR